MEVKQFPIDIQIGTFQNENDIELWMNNQWHFNNEIIEFTPIDYCLIQHSPFIYTESIDDIITRYSLFKTHGIISFSNNYDEMPAKWIDILNLIDIELNKAREQKAKIK